MSTETCIIVREPQGFRPIYPTIATPSYSPPCRLSYSLSYGSMYVLYKERLGLPLAYHIIMSRLVPCEVTVYSQPLRRLSRATSLFSRLHSGPVASCMMSTTQETISPVTQGSPWMALVALWRSLSAPSPAPALSAAGGFRSF